MISTGMPASICISGAPAAQAAEQQRGEQDADRVGAPEQRDRDRVEADGRAEGGRHDAASRRGKLDRAGEPGQAAAQRHGQHDQERGRMPA